MDARQLRRRIAEIADRLNVRAEPEYTHGTWRWTWLDGPTVEQVRAELGPTLADRIELTQRYSTTATALDVVLAVRDGIQRGPTPQPDQASDARTGALAAALAATVPAFEADSAVAVRRHLRELGGLATLLRPYTGHADTDSDDALAMTALEHLTDRYAAHLSGEAAKAWREHLACLDARAAVEAALDDQTADRTTRLATVGLLGQLRRELETQEAQALTAATDAGASYTDLGRALGVTRQVAHRRHRARTAAQPARLSPQARQR